MKLKISKILVSLIIILFSFSCAPIYIPSAHNIPQVNKKGDIQAGLMLGTNGVDLQGSYATKDNQAVMLAISGPLTNEDNYNRHLYLEGGYGIFNRAPSKLRMSAFGGFGFGASHGESNLSVNGKPYNRVTNGTYIKPFVQGNIGLHTDVVDVGLSSRFALLSFQYAEIDGQTIDGQTATLMIEPVAYLSLGWKGVKVGAIAGLSFPANNISFDYFPIMVGLGVQLMFDAIGENQ